ncbi:MAG TPA: biotin--[acetyl-CoA-carboxylase] ligase [Polyangiaceae bacterium]|nr:biotin--[acetyl-CoA-carboxylase] ligase [Polyangiaceae bacterium]
MNDASLFDASAFEARREALGGRFGVPLVRMAETGSTNDDALEAAKRGERHGAVFVADAQRSGRGRRGSAWTSPPAENLTFSVLIRPEAAPERVSAVALVAGLAVRDAVAARVRDAVSLKWPNDVLCTGRKIAGILVESRMEGSAVEAVVVGIGVNVHMRDLPAEIATIATSLALLGDPSPSREALLAEILAGFERRLSRFEAAGLIPMLSELNDHDALRGRPITVGDVTGVGCGIGDEGALLVRDAHGAVHRVTSGTVRL